MRAALIGFVVMLVFGASASAAARVVILDDRPAETPATAPVPSDSSEAILLLTA